MEVINAADFAKNHIKGAKKKGNKYNVAPKEQRTIGTRTYDSKAEAQYAEMLAGELARNLIVEWIPQPAVQLGADTVYRPDFLVIDRDGPFYVDVKGVETADFKRTKRLWAKYGRLPLHIVKKTGTGFGWKTVEVVEGPKR